MNLLSCSRYAIALFLLMFSATNYAQSPITDQLEIDQQQAEINNSEVAESSEDFTQGASSDSSSFVEESTTETDSGYDAVTVYLDAKYGRRTKGAAKSITKKHQEWAAKGYRLQDVDLYTENSDLRGFFITYIRD